MFKEMFDNKGPLLSNARLEALHKRPNWDCDDRVALLKAGLETIREKHGEYLNSDMTEPQTKFYMVNPILHELGFVYSIAETVPMQIEVKTKVDYTLFSSPETFADAEHMRGATNFFRNAVGLCQAAAWGESLEVSEDPEVASQQPMVLMDIYLRHTGVDFGIVTNGPTWRLVHRGSSENLSTFVEFDLLKTASGPIEALKYFYLLFNVKAFVRGDEGTSFMDGLLE